MLYDDLWSIAGNPSIRRLWPIWPVLNPPEYAGVGERPILNLTFALNYGLGHDSVLGYHAVNIAVHVLAACVLFGLLRHTLLRPAMSGKFGNAATSLSLAASAIWALHPIQTISVTYISGRAESLMGLFYLLTLYCFVRGSETDRNANRTLWHSLSVMSCLAGAGTKEVIITAPLMVFLYDRTFVSGAFASAWRRNWRLYLLLLAALFPVAHRIFILQQGTVVAGVGFGGGIVWWEYALVECQAVVHYLRLAFWPSPLIFDYGRCIPVSFSQAWPYCLLMGALLASTIAALRRLPILGFAGCWFFLILAPTSSVVPIVGQAIAENRVYLPLAGIVVAAVLSVFAMIGPRSWPVLALLAIGFGLASFHRNAEYQSDLRIWNDTVAKNPESARPHGNLGKVLARIPSRVDEAIAEYQKASRLDPLSSEVHVNLGNLWFRIPGHLDDAIAQYREALGLHPDDADAHFDLACALAKIPTRTHAAADEYLAAIRFRPDFAAAHINLGNLLIGIPGRTDEGLAHLQEAVRVRPDFAEAHFALATALMDVPGRFGEARTQLIEVLRLQPDNDEARQMLESIPAP